MLVEHLLAEISINDYFACRFFALNTGDDQLYFLAR